MGITCIGLVTLDVLHFVPRLPRDDEKLVATCWRRPIVIAKIGPS